MAGAVLGPWMMVGMKSRRGQRESRGKEQVKTEKVFRGSKFSALIATKEMEGNNDEAGEVLVINWENAHFWRLNCRVS